jgi:glucan phosphoethanolaminetransferase (alkaline phosphatase superfamily)
LAKLTSVANHGLPLTIWTPLVYIWQDLLIVLLFAVVDRIARFHWIVWALYGLVVGYAALNVPVIRVLGSALTVPMVRAAQGALSGSIVHHVTPGNLGSVLIVIAAGLGLPVLLRTITLKRWGIWLTLSVAIIIIGQSTVDRIDTNGLHRNALITLASSARSRIPSVAGFDEWRSSPFGESRSDDLFSLVGTATGRNVVLISLESTGANYLRPYGSETDPMPYLTELAEQSVLFQNAYAVYPESIKGLFSILCSQYPAMDTQAESYSNVTVPSLADVLREQGYKTALYHSGRFMYLGMEAIVSNRGFEVLEDAGAIGGQYESSFGVDEESTIGRIFAWLDGLAREERFFLTYLPIAGHHPYDTPHQGPFRENDDAGRYLNALNYSDRMIAKLVNGLCERGLEGNTLFVIIGDHAQAFGQHEGNYGHSLFLYDENIKVPFLIVAPGLITDKIRIERTASLVDTAPTILNLLGLAAPINYQGNSLLDGDQRMALFYADYSLSLLGLRDGCWKYIYELESGRSELFDLCEDKNEKDDQSDGNRDRVTAYRDHLERWGAAQKARILNSISTVAERSH